MEDFLDYIGQAKRYSPKTVEAYRADLLQFQRFLQSSASLELPEATFYDVRGWIVALTENNISASSINRKIACLRSYYKYLLRQEVISTNPTLKIKILKTKKRLPHFVQEQDMSAVLNRDIYGEGFHGARNYLMMEMLYGTGIRRAELIDLQDAHVNISDSTIRVLGKRNKERVIPFATNLKSLIQSYRKLRNHEIASRNHGKFFVTEKGAPLYPVLVNRVVKDIMSKFDQVEKKSPHVLRHTYATHLLNKGAEINAVKDLLGHSNLSATQVYTHNSIEKLKKAFDQAHPKA